MTRDNFLDRMRSALRAWSQPAPHYPDPTTSTTPTPARRPAPAPLVNPPGNGELAALFAEMFTAAGGLIHWAATSDAALAATVQIAKASSVRSVIITRHPELIDFPQALTTAGLTVTVVGFGPDEPLSSAQRTRQRNVMAQADLVVSGADYAIAETGTLAMVAGAHNPRVATLLPPLHVAILDPQRLVSTMLDLVAQFKAEHLRDGRLDISSLTFITGPSRTGDIEQTLSVGVHGPGEVHVILLRAPDTRSSE